MGIQDRIHELFVAVNCSVVRHGISTGTIDAIKQTIINDITALTLSLFSCETHQIFSQTFDTGPRKDTENVALWVGKLGRGVSTEAGQILSEECLDAGQGQMR